MIHVGGMPGGVAHRECLLIQSRGLRYRAEHANRLPKRPFLGIQNIGNYAPPDDRITLPLVLAVSQNTRYSVRSHLDDGNRGSLHVRRSDG